MAQMMPLTESAMRPGAASRTRGRRALKACIRTVLGAVALTLAGATHAGGLFLPADSVGELADDVTYGAKSATVRPSRAGAPDMWERRVRIARQELAVAREDVESFGAGRLLLNVREDMALDVVVERTAPTNLGYSLSGRVTGERTGFVTLVVHDEAVAGSIWTPESAYELRHLGGGDHALRDVTNVPPIECGGVQPTEFTAEDTAPQELTDDGSVVDILMLWSPYYEEQVGESQVLADIDFFIAYTNDALARSGALVSLNVVGSKLAPDAYGGRNNHSALLGDLVSPDDGVMDYVHDWRDELGADFVHLISLGLRNGVASPSTGFSVGEASYYVTAHEIGHLHGIGHERLERRGCIHCYGFTDSRGRYRDHDDEADVRCDITLMSYGRDGGGCSSGGKVPFYSSPWRYSPSDGRPLGVPRFSKIRGIRGPADAVRTINRNRHRNANRRPSKRR